MPVNLVRDADVTAISLVKRGANRKRFFLLKSQPEGDEQTEPLPAGRIVKAADWSAAYIVVAEPGAHEDPGSAPGTDQAVEDRWASEDEIRKAAHRWMHNGGLVNKMHEDLTPYGQVVENFIAPEDFTVDGETIRKGSWVIGIEPTADGKAAIEKGEFTGVSIEGVAIREQVEKREGSTPPAPTVGTVENKTLLRKFAEFLGVSPEEVEAINKADLTFGSIVAHRELDELLPEAFDAFREGMWNAFFPCDSESDPKALIARNCDEFKRWCLDQVDAVPVEKAERAKALGVELDSEGSTQPPGTKDGDMALTDSERQEFDDLKKAVEKIDPDKMADSFAARLAKALGAPADDETPTAESIAKQAKALAGVTDADEVKQKVAKIEADVAKLAEGASSQSEDDGEETPPSVAEVKARVAKAFEAQGLDSSLAGVL